ncbi:hypothetical protein Nocox_33780 [Nonomuraea coxensis DSM 45129]|uniref:Uncharacterized protein n=1 Tax=Nonomuraea coxensis DSM 45129 TaxID=1122611 RepID=A0ABX8UC83_9ACTN|nr:hypothetical protein [Nonomuraea coxensis]QYC44323.1 hypothetical protein Nocox_33780 [Nonomuraea coxensis DSM 45129]
MSTSTFRTAIGQARDLLRWRSPLRTELWAARLLADLEPEHVEPFLRELTGDGGAEARLTLAALAAVAPQEQDHDVPRTDDGTGTDDNRPGTDDDGLGPGESPAGGSVFGRAAEGALETLPGWARRMGRVVCEAAWYGRADPYGEQVLAALSFRYENGKEPHVLVVGIDQPHGGLAVDAMVEEVKFLDDLGLAAAEPGVVAGRVLDAFELGDRLLGAEVADTLPGVRALAVARARGVPGLVRGAGDDAAERFAESAGLPELPGAREAFGKLREFVGDHSLWWSPARVSRFLTSWLPREAILSDAAIAAMPEVVRAWTRFNGDQPAVSRRIDEDAPRLAALMADDSLAGLGKRLARNRPAEQDDPEQDG